MEFGMEREYNFTVLPSLIGNLKIRNYMTDHMTK